MADEALLLVMYMHIHMCICAGGGVDWDPTILSVPGQITRGPEAGAPAWGVHGRCYGTSPATRQAAPHDCSTGAAGKAIGRNVFGDSAATSGQLRRGGGVSE